MHRRDSGTFAQSKRHPLAEPGNQDGDQRVCPICLPPPSSAFHILGGTQPEAAAGHLTTLKRVCRSQRGCCLAATRPSVLPARLELQQKFNGLCVAGRAVGSLLVRTSCSLIGWAHDALCSATGKTGILPEPPLPPWARPRTKPCGMRPVHRACQGRTTRLCQEEAPVCRLVPGCGGTSGAHGPEKRESEVLLLMLSEPGGTRTRRDAQMGP